MIKAPAHREHDIQASCVRWMRLQYPREATMLFAIPNGAHLAGTAKQRAAHWARLEREGAKAEGWKNYTIVGKVGAGKVLTIKKTK